MGTIRHIHNTFKETCMAMRLLEDNGKWIGWLQEASLFANRITTTIFVCDNIYILHSKSTNKFVGIVLSSPMWELKTSIVNTTLFRQSQWTWSLWLWITYHWWNFERTLQYFTMQHTMYATIYYIQWVVHHQNPLIVKQLDWNHESPISIVNEHVPHLNP